MTQTVEFQAQSALPDIFSSALTEIFQTAKQSIVQVSTEQRGGGTGIIWHKDGRIITNNHVVGRDDARVQVHLADGRTLDAKVLQRNPRLDLALLKVNADKLQDLPTGDSAKLRVGEWVFAIGHPWGQRWVITSGIISAISVVKLAEDLTTQYLKSDVQLAPGNSGGPLLNAEGQVVGINAMIFGGDLSIAIPSHVVNTWLESLPRGRRKLGVALQAIEVNLPEKPATTGLMIVGIGAERQMAHQDLLVGDIVLTVQGQAVPDVATLRKLIDNDKESVSMQIVRGGKSISVEVTTLAAESNV